MLHRNLILIKLSVLHADFEPMMLNQTSLNKGQKLKKLVGFFCTDCVTLAIHFYSLYFLVQWTQLSKLDFFPSQMFVCAATFLSSNRGSTYSARQIGGPYSFTHSVVCFIYGWRIGHTILLCRLPL